MSAWFTFGEYRVRPVEERDRAYLTTLITQDPYHRDRMDADFFLKTVPGEDAWAVEDGQGVVRIYFKTATAVRIFLQFADGDGAENRKVLKQGFDWLTVMLSRNRFREVIFDTEAPPLKAMAKRRLGFREAGEQLVMSVPTIEEFESAREGWHHEPSTSEDGEVSHVRSN